MKRKILAWTAAAVLAALVSVCFFRPAPSALDLSGGPYTWTEPVTLELSGPDADKFEAAWCGLGLSSSEALGPDIRLAVYSTDGKYYSLGKSVWVKGWNTAWQSVTGNPYDPEADESIGTAEHLGENGWEEFSAINDVAAHTLMFNGKIYNAAVPADSERRANVKLNIPYREPGHYRVTIYARELLDDGTDRLHFCSSTGGLLSFSFEYDVPEHTNAPLEIMLVNLRRSATGELYESEEVAELEVSLRANGDMRCMQKDSFLFERFNTESGSYEPVIASEKDGSYFSNCSVYCPNIAPFERAEKHIRSRYPDVDRDELWYGILSTVPMPQVILRGWSETDQFRLSVDFAENPDGSGERYTVTIPLYFGE